MEERPEFDSEMAATTADELLYYSQALKGRATQMAGCDDPREILKHLRFLGYYHRRAAEKICALEKLAEGFDA